VKPLDGRVIRGVGIRVITCFLSLTLSACVAIYHPTNEPISEIDEQSGYRRIGGGDWDQLGDSVVLLAFSGGGTRAAALSYGVMQELRDTVYLQNGEEKRVLDEVDSISSVSGGSFTAAYYGLNRDGLFETFERDFLRESIQRRLILQMLNPAHWMRSLFSGFDRTEMAVSYYDKNIFRGATFDDLTKNGRPYIDINATDLTTGLRFTFTQERFDLLCTDLGSFPVARAVTASSAVPVVFPTVVLENHADQCDIDQSVSWQRLNELETEGEAQGEMLEGLKSYRNVEERRYIHLVDGGISDNLGLRAITDRMEVLEDQALAELATVGVDNVLIILVNAAVQAENFIEETPEKPSTATTMSAFSNVQMQRYNQETQDRLSRIVADLEERSAAAGHAIDVFYSEVSFDHVQSAEINRFFNNMPTTLELDDEEVDRLILAGRILLRNEPSFVAFKQRWQAELAPGAVEEEKACDFFLSVRCLKSPAD
jgi:NTE family protein